MTENDVARMRWLGGTGGQPPRGQVGAALLGVLALLLAGCAGPLLAPSTPPASALISGVVFGDRAQEQEAGRTVLAPLAATVVCNGVQAITGVDGRFSLTVKTAGRYTCLANAPSYQAAQAVLAGAGGPCCGWTSGAPCASAPV